jgi:signal transduction histidine kinase
MGDIDLLTRRDRSERLLPALGLVLTCVMLAMSYVPADTSPPRGVDAVAIGLLVLAFGSLIAIRRRPMWSLALSLAACSVWFPRGYKGAWPAAALVVAIYAVARVAATRRRLITVLSVITVSAASMLLAGVNSFITAVGILGWMAAAALLGDAVRQRGQLVAAHSAQLASLQAEQSAIVDRRLAEERLAVSRDVHDVLAHTLAAVSLHAGAAGDLIDPAHPAAPHVAQVRRSIADAVTDVRRSIGGMRHGAANMEPVPGWPALLQLLEECRNGGTEVELRTRGVDVESVPELVGVCVYRLAQEGITNIRRHSQATTAVLEVLAEGVDLHVTLEDPGPRRLPAGSPGHGLAGMTERVQGVGGTFHSGPTPRGGFLLTAVFPACLVPM